MPIYEYECTECGNRFEILQGINEKPRLQCEVCGGKKAHRVLSPGAFVFKGNGFYATDYKKKESKPAACDSCSKSESCPASKE